MQFSTKIREVVGKVLDILTVETVGLPKESKSSFLARWRQTDWGIVQKGLFAAGKVWYNTGYEPRRVCWRAGKGL